VAQGPPLGIPQSHVPPWNDGNMNMAPPGHIQPPPLMQGPFVPPFMPPQFALPQMPLPQTQPTQPQQINVSLPTETEVTTFINRFASFVHKNGLQFEKVIMNKEEHNPKFQFFYSNKDHKNNTIIDGRFILCCKVTQ